MGAKHLELPGGEMLTWSDQPVDHAAGDGHALAALAEHAVPKGARVLLAGHHDLAVVDLLLAREADLTCLVRGYSDGEKLSARAGGTGMRVIVGSLATLESDARFDAVLALSGLPGIGSTEGAQLDWDATLARLARAVRPDGVLMIRLDNPMGLNRIVEMNPWYAARSDSAWAVTGALDSSQPVNLDQLRAHLSTVGLGSTALFAAYPRPDQASTLVAVEELDRSPDSGLLDGFLHRTCIEGFVGETVLRDPARLAVDALHAGLGSGLAPAWVAIASGSSIPNSSELPIALFETGAPRGSSAALVEVMPDLDRWRWHARGLTPPVKPQRGSTKRDTADAVIGPHRDLSRLIGPVPAGRLLRTVLLDACLRRDLDAVRTLLSGYADWLTTHADSEGRLAGEFALATLDNVIINGTNLAVLDPTWQAVERVHSDRVLARGLWLFASELLTGGYANPWPSTMDISGLTVVLGGLAGRSLDRAVVASAIDAEATVRSAMRGLNSTGRAALAAGLRTLDSTSPPSHLDSYQQLREAWTRQHDELVHLREKMDWTEQMLNSREGALRRANLTISLSSGSVGYRVGFLILYTGRMVKRMGHRAARLMRSRGDAEEMQ